jgi:hypothetical protein
LFFFDDLTFLDHFTSLLNCLAFDFLLRGRLLLNHCISRHSSSFQLGHILGDSILQHLLALLVSEGEVFCEVYACHKRIEL